MRHIDQLINNNLIKVTKTLNIFNLIANFLKEKCFIKGIIFINLKSFKNKINKIINL